MNSRMTVDLWGGVCSPQGFQAAGIVAGIKVSGKPDLAVLRSDSPAQCFGVFTTNHVKAAPVLFDQNILAAGHPVSGVVVNSGNANACTGPEGEADTLEMAALTCQELGLLNDQILVCSTGVIGHRLPMDKLRTGIPQVCAQLAPQNSGAFAQAILTTDTVEKSLSVQVQTEKGTVTIGGASKGSGMIHPNMATMLAFVTTDVKLPADLQAEFKAWIDDSFNSITVDGDTSTNDTCLLFANGASGIHYQELGLTDQGEIRQAIQYVLRELAIKIVRDGEGANHLVAFTVQGARSRSEARQIGRYVCTSKLVKTALFGKDPNWGRILSSAGSAGIPVQSDCIDLFFEKVCVLENGRPVTLDREALKTLHDVVAQKEYAITLDLKLGDASATLYTCDLSYEYVRINAEYTT